MRVLILTDKTDELEEGDTCVDPKDKAGAARTHYVEVGPAADVLVLFRDVVGDPDSPDGWPRWHLYADGVFEHVRMKDFKKILRRLGVS